MLSLTLNANTVALNNNSVVAELDRRMAEDTANGTFAEMQKNMDEDPEGIFAALEAKLQEDTANGVYDKMQADMAADLDGTFARLQMNLEASSDGFNGDVIDINSNDLIIVD